MDVRPKLLTVEDYASLANGGQVSELVRGVVVYSPFPPSEYGYICGNFGYAIGQYAKARDLGRMCLSCGVVTERNPDTVRGVGVAFYSFDLVPRGPLPGGYWPTPELIVELRSPSNTHQELADKAAEYLAARAVVVLIADPDTESVAVHTANELPVRLSNGDELTLPMLFPDFRVPVRTFFA